MTNRVAVFVMIFGAGMVLAAASAMAVVMRYV